MNRIQQRILPSLFFLTSISATVNADSPYVDPNEATIASNTGNVATYLLNLGSYFGFDLTQQPKNIPPATLLSDTTNELLGSGGSSLPFFSVLFDTLLGAIPVNVSLVDATLKQFVPSSNSAYAPINSFANTTFPSYDSDGSQQSNVGSVSVNSLIDQPTFQQDPISQAVLNILATPDYTFCMNNDGTQWTGNVFGDGGGGSSTKYPDCSFLYRTNIMNNTIGSLPKPQDFFSYKYNQPFLNQLNSNTLLAPLLYSTTGNGQTPNPGNQGSTPGLTAQNQAQEAANFIRYATGIASPIPLPNYSDYATLYGQATTTDGSIPTQTVVRSQSLLAAYFTNLRVYAAQSSVGISNLYYIFSKRMPQNMGTSKAASMTSQALSEFTMATWRLYNPSGGANTQWLTQLNQASSQAVGKEIATLLAEINYQLYLNRQQEERLLMTNTMLLFQNARAGQPSPPSPTDSTGNTPSS